MAGMTERVLVVDDHPVVVDGLVAGLRAHGIDEVSTASTLAEAKALLQRERIDVVLLDLRLPDGSGTSLLRFAQSLDPRPAVVILSSFRSPEYLDVTMRLGAKGYLLKTAPIEEVVAAVRRAASGLSAFTSEEALEVHSHQWTPLTARGHEILSRLIAGRSNDEIGGDLGISTKRVEAHLSRMYARYGVGSRVELALRAERDNWLDLPVADPQIDPDGDGP